MKQKEFFTSRWGLILSTLGIAVGTGNIWRFSRVTAQNGGGSFLIPWVIFLLLWSVPLIIAEFAIGKSSRLSPIGAIAKTAGHKFAWMGAFIAFVSTAIMFYYSVVAGWCIRYFISAVNGDLFNVSNHLVYWNDFSDSYLPLVFHFIAMTLCATIVYRGIVNGIEKINRIFVSSLLIILIILLLRAVTLPNAIEGLTYFFTPDLNKLLDYKIWLNALTQNAWDTGAGWGLIMTYAIYMKKKEDISLNAALIGFGNNSVSLIAGMMIFSAVFALGGNDAINQISQSGPANTGITFIYLPLLFSKMSGSIFINTVFASLFFIALSFAAITSLVSMIELATRSLIDFGIIRKKAIVIIGLTGFVFGIPSALDMSFLINQDWVWGVALILSGFFIAFSIIRFGTDRFRKEIINGYGSDYKIGKWYNIIIQFIVPLQAVVLLLWWLISSTTWDPEWWNPFHTENLGTCIFQWFVILFTFIMINKMLVQYSLKSD